MATIRIRIESHPAAYQALYGSVRIGENMYLRGKLVESRAKRELQAEPKRVDTGRLRASINTQRVIRFVGGFRVRGARIGTEVFYGILVHKGTGIYGPRRTPIVPRRASVLRFKPRGSAIYIYARSVKGMKPNHFLTNALPAARLR
jgi:hypothetical protein